MTSALNDPRMTSCNDKCAEWPPNDLKHYEVKGAHICVTRNPESQFSVCFALQPTVFHSPFWDKDTEWAENDLKFYDVKDTSYLSY